jgi:AraC-like DNA-binding protein
VFSIVPETAECFAKILLEDRRLQRLERHIRTRLHEPLTLKRAAELCGLSPTWFSNYFRVRTGVTFTVWYRGVRIERAKLLLVEPGLKIEAIAYDVGYGHVSTFERAFRTCTGACPKAYREALKWLRDGTIRNAYKSVRNADHTARNAEFWSRAPRILVTGRRSDAT